jgi:hypothetical protein
MLPNFVFERDFLRKPYRYYVESDHDTAPLFLHRSSWRYIDSGGKQEYHITGDFC